MIMCPIARRRTGTRTRTTNTQGWKQGTDMLADIIEPPLRDVAHLIVQSGAPISDAWAGYTRDEDLIPLRQTADDNLHFVRANDPSARIEAFKIHPVDPKPGSLVFHEPTVLRSESKATAAVEIDNRGGLTQQAYTFHKVFRTGESESNAIGAAFSAESKSEIGTGQSSPYKFSQTFTITVSSSWTRTTGRTKDTETGGNFPLVALPKTRVTGYLAWDEQDLRRRIDCDGSYDFGIRIGRRRKSGRKQRWRWYSGDLMWYSLGDLIATAEGRGSVDFPLFEHWGRNHPGDALLGPVRHRPQLPITQYVQYRGADSIRVVIDTLDDLRVIPAES